MTLKISKANGQFMVDDTSRPGSPAVGRGRTMKEAIGDYFHANQAEFGIAFDVDASAQNAELRRRNRETGRR
jgi:hypothetical protein